MPVFLVVAVLSGCGPEDPCARAERTSVTFPDKIAACQMIAAPSFDPSTCKASLTSCTHADEAAITSYFDCLDKLPTCTVASDFTSAVLACANHMSALTPGCFGQP